MGNRTNAKKWGEGGGVLADMSVTGWSKGGALWKFNGVEDTMPGIILVVVL